MSYKLHNTYIKPQNYFNKLFIFFTLISLSLTLSLIGFDFSNMDIFMLKFVIIYFMLLSIAVFIEFYNLGDYMGPLEIFDVENFYLEFINNIKDANKLEFVHKYDYKSKKVLEKLQKENAKYFLSTIKKKKKMYEITFINQKKMAGFFIVKFLVKNPMHKAFVTRNKNGFIIHRLI